MEDTYAYITVKLYLKSGQTEDSIQEIVQDLDYNFAHEDILDHEIVDILDTQLPLELSESEEDEFVDPFDMSSIVSY